MPVFPPNFTVSDFLAIERHADEHLSVYVLENKPPRRFAPCLLDAGEYRTVDIVCNVSPALHLKHNSCHMSRWSTPHPSVI